MDNQREDLNVCHKIIAKYIGKDVESMRQLKRRWEAQGGTMWVHYVRSYRQAVGHPLYTHCTRTMFFAIKATETYEVEGKTLILDAKNHRVALNDNGVCTVEQFGNLEIAENKFNQIKETL